MRGPYRLSQDYIKAMIDVMHQAEDLENLDNLHSLCGLMQTIRESSSPPLRKAKINYVVMMSDHSMYEHILDDDRFFGVLGMLECAFQSSASLSSSYDLHNR
jgi:protein phosphatase 4 regulatory subunit 3